jgi:hypothetical protein
MYEKQFEKFKIITSEALGFDPEENAKLSTHYSANPEGDWVGLACILRLLLEQTDKEQELNILEVGTAHGHFLRSFYEFLEKQKDNWKTNAYGVDSKLHGYCPCMFVENSKVKVGGYFGFHDSSPTFQGGSEQPRTPECSEDTHIHVVKGIENSGIKQNGFEFVLEEYHTDDKYYGGVTVFKRVK